MDIPNSSSDTKSPPKAPVVRGARACTVCRAAKMKCVGAEDGNKQCQRCKRANVDCVFEKHRRGRKPGSKLSEASKMLRRLEKGLNSAKAKSQVTTEPALAGSYPSDSRASSSQDPPFPPARSDSTFSSPTSHLPSNQLPPLNLPYSSPDAYNSSTHTSRNMDIDDDEEDPDRNGENIFPVKLIRRENERNSFFRTVLGPDENTPPSNPPPTRGASFTPPRTVPGLNDPISAGLITEDDAKVLFDLIFLRLNPFINLFDPTLHTVPYVRSRCPFLFTTLIMAGCKFFKPELFKECQKLAHQFAVRAFADAWKRVEVVQAFACLTYWKDPNDNRTWTYIGYACRMAVELSLNNYILHPPSNENEFQRLERRNRERTYLVLFVHDRSLSIQTGRHWMLPEDDLIRNSGTWHEQCGGTIRQEDVIVAAFVSLRRIAAETTDILNASKGSTNGNHVDINYEVILRNCNVKLTTWADTWQREMERAGGEKFHSCVLNFFRLHVRLFLNSFGIQSSMSPSSRVNPSLQALSACCSSALDSLRIVSKDFASMSMLRYGQDSITVMSAYSAVFLLRLLRSSNTLAQLPDGTAEEIYSLISKTADAYYDASILSPASTSAAYHARFLRSLVANDIFRSRRNERERHDGGVPIDPRLQASPGPTGSHASAYSGNSTSSNGNNTNNSPNSAATPIHPVNQPSDSYQFPGHSSQHQQENDYDLSIRHIPGTGVGVAVTYPGYAPAAPQHASELDAHYWKNMFIELGFGDTMEAPAAPGPPQSSIVSDERGGGLYVDGSHYHQHSQHHQHQSNHHQGHQQVSYHPATQPHYAHQP